MWTRRLSVGNVNFFGCTYGTYYKSNNVFVIINLWFYVQTTYSNSRLIEYIAFSSAFLVVNNKVCVTMRCYVKRVRWFFDEL